MPVAAGITNVAEGRFLAVNKMYQEVFGYGPEDLLGHTSSEFGIWVNPEDRSQVIALLQQGCPVHAVEIPIQRKDGSRGWVSYSGDLVMINGEQCLLSGAVDISRSKEAEDGQQKSAAMLRTLIDTIPDLVWLKDSEGSTSNAIHASSNSSGLPGSKS